MVLKFEGRDASIVGVLRERGYAVLYRRGFRADRARRGGDRRPGSVFLEVGGLRLSPRRWRRNSTGWARPLPPT